VLSAAFTRNDVYRIQVFKIYNKPVLFEVDCGHPMPPNHGTVLVSNYGRGRPPKLLL